MSKKNRTRVIGLKVEWYENPQMVGHHRAIAMHRLAWQELKPFCKTKAQREFVQNSINFSNPHWDYWCGVVSKKQISQIKHVLKGLKRGESWTELYHWVNHRHGMIMDSMTRYLEVKSYDENPTEFLRFATSWHVSLGMKQAEANERINSRIESYRKGLE